MKIDKEVMEELESYMASHLKQLTQKNASDDVRDYHIEAACKLSQLILNLCNIQAQEVQLGLLESMKGINFSAIDFNKALNGLMKGDV